MRASKIAGVAGMWMLSTTLLSSVALAKGPINTNSPNPEDECNYCHKMMDKPFVHEAAIMGCSNCHEPHGTKTGFAKRLKAGANDLCFQCHEEQRITVNGKGHPVQNHPVLGWRDPLYPEKKLTCVSCHNPHSAPSRKLFRYEYGKYTPYGEEQQGGACLVCHYKTAGTPGLPHLEGDIPVPDWNTGR